MDNCKTITLKGLTRYVYLFNVFPWESELPPVSAVYSILRRDKHGYSVIYIGNTGKLDTHLSEHALLAKFEAEGKTHIGIHVEPVMSKRHSKKMDLVSSYTPALNLSSAEFGR